ncbi:MAG: DUF839 domain-containing protein [Pseudomonadota bacterium]|nr:MAG: DUF839 domain-containing protein [Pseudomonadota bacterium]
MYSRDARYKERSGLNATCRADDAESDQPLIEADPQLTITRLTPFVISRRAFLRGTVLTALGITIGGGLRLAHSRAGGIAALGPLQGPDENGLLLPVGFRSRVVARSGIRPLPKSAYRWHAAPDGGATFASNDGGWIYVSNSEMPNGNGGAGALRFDSAGNMADAYSILTGTSRNCGGGATPWNTWLSCEEVDGGQVWECDPFALREPIVRPLLGRFAHEAVAVDPRQGQLYLTEDKPNGCLYRFTPARRNKLGHPDLSTGTLEVAEVLEAQGGRILWHAVPDPDAKHVPTRKQVAVASRFRGGEGIAWHAGIVYFTTKGDDRVWAYDVSAERIRVFYDHTDHEQKVLTGVDNVTISPAGDVLVAEDGGDLQIVAVIPGRQLVPVVQLAGHDDSEMTGPAFDPAGTRLYFSSQRGTTGRWQDGITFEVTGRF